MKFISLFILFTMKLLDVSAQLDSSFSQFMERFEKVDLPVKIDSTCLENYSVISSYSGALQNSEISKYINPSIDFSDPYPSQYFPIYKFAINEFWGLIIQESTGAGGVNDTYILYIYDSTGKYLSFSIIAQYIGDCSFVKLSTVDIDQTGKIAIKHCEKELDCDSDKVISTKYIFQEQSIEY